MKKIELLNAIIEAVDDNPNAVLHEIQVLEEINLPSSKQKEFRIHIVINVPENEE